MISRMSSGSSRAESPVEPTRSQNLLPSGMSALQLGHCTDRLPDLTRRAYHLSIVSGPLVRDRDQLWVEVRFGSSTDLGSRLRLVCSSPGNGHAATARCQNLTQV